MKVKITSLPQETPQNQSWGKWAMQLLPRNVLRIGARVVEAPGMIGDLLQGLQGIRQAAFPQELLQKAPEQYKQPLQDLYKSMTSPSLIEQAAPYLTTQSIKENVTTPAFEKVGLKGWEQPQNIVEEGLDFIASDLPLILLTEGGSLGKDLFKRLGYLATGKAAKLGAREFGVGEAGQLVAELGLPIGASTLIKNRPSQFMNYLRGSQKELYEKTKPLAATYFEKAEGLQNAFKKELDALYGSNSGLDKAARRNTIKRIEEAQSILKQGDVNILNAIEKKQHLNNLMKSETNETAYNYLKRIVGAINKEIEQAGNKYPDFGVPYRAAENLTKALGESQKARDYISSVLSVEDFKNVPSILKTVIAGAKATFPLYFNTIFSKYPQAWEYVGNMFTAAVNEQKGSLIANARKLDKLLETEKNKQQIKIIKLGK